MIDGLAKYRLALSKRELSLETIARYASDVLDFVAWLGAIKLSEVKSAQVLGYVESLKQHGLGPQRINSYLNSLSQYYRLVHQDYNPVGSLRLQSHRGNVLEQVLDYEELELLYASHPSGSDREKRNRVLLGLLVYQGLSTGDIHQLKVKSVDLEKGRLSIPVHGRTNGRELELKVFQVLALQEYLLVVRPRLLEQLSGVVAGRRAVVDARVGEQLFFSRSGSVALKNSLKYLFVDLKNLNPKVVSVKQLRASVLAHWLRDRDVRQVQYLAGHRYVSSTERYDLYRYEALKTQLEQYHPLQAS